MLFTNFAQFVVLALVLIMGFTFGLASNNGRKKWRQRYDNVVENSNTYRAEIAGQLRDAESRIATLESENATLRAQASGPPEKPVTVPAPVTPAAAPAKKSWFAWGGDHRDDGDDLTRLRGLDTDLAARLRGLGVTRYTDISEMSAEDEIALEQRLTIPAGYITREQWREQAELLEGGNIAKHKKRFGATT